MVVATLESAPPPTVTWVDDATYKSQMPVPKGCAGKEGSE